MISNIIERANQAALATAIGFVHIDAAQINTPHNPQGRYLYRGYAIIGDADGWSVWDPRDANSEDDLGWGMDMANAMAIVDELVEDYR